MTGKQKRSKVRIAAGNGKQRKTNDSKGEMDTDIKKENGERVKKTHEQQGRKEPAKGEKLGV